LALSNLNPNEKTDEELLLEAGYKKVGDFFITPNFDKDILSMIPVELLNIMKQAGIKVLSFREGSESAMSGGIRINKHSIGEISFTRNNSKDRIAHNILHEVGHYIYSNILSAQQKEVADKFKNPISYYVQNLIDGALSSGATVSEENFVEGFATYFHNKIFGKKSISTKIESHLVPLYRELYNNLDVSVNVSEVIDAETGEPKVVYHGTQQKFNQYIYDSDPTPVYQTTPSKQSKLIEVVRQANEKGIKGIHIVSQSDLVNEDVYVRSAKGFVRNGEIYINIDRAGDDTIIHEFGHLYLADAKNNNRLAYYKLLDKIKDTPL
jgi:hypothetical protein